MAEMKLKFVIDAVDKSKVAMKSAQGNIDTLQGKMKRMRPTLDRIAKGFALIAAAVVVGFGVKSIQAAVKFEKAMTNVATLVNTSTENMIEMGKKVKDISKRIPKDLAELTEALYDVRSAGISAGDAMEVLETSGKLAVAGLSTVKEATNLLTSAINVYGDESHDANVIAEILFKTVKYGKTTIAGLAQGFGKVAAIAKETGISLEDLSAATAILTITGITAAESQTALKAMISNVLKPTTDATDAAERLGIQFDLAALQADGLAGMLVAIAEKAGDDKQALADLFGSVEAANAIFSLTSKDGAAKFKEILDDMTISSGALDEAFIKQNETTDAQYQLLKNNLNVVMTDLGTTILPHVVKAVQWLIKYLKNMSEGIKVAGEWWNKWIIDPLTDFLVLADKVERKIRDIIRAAREAVSAVGKVLTGGKEGIPWVPFFEKGGVVPGMPGQAVPIIAHAGETIIPAGQRGIGGNTYKVYIQGGTYLSEDVAEEIGDMIIDRLKTNMKL